VEESALTAPTIPYGPPALDAVATALTDLFAGFLDPSPPPDMDLPAAHVALAGIQERSAGIGRYTGAETRGAFGVSTIKAIRIEALIRLVVWAAEPDAAAAATSALAGRLLHGVDVLRTKGVLRLDLVGSSAAEQAETGGAWRTGTECRVLYEQLFRDTDGADSLIARIPLVTELERRKSDRPEITVVTDAMARWDTLTAPTLVARGRSRVGRITALTFLPTPGPSGAVTVLRTFEGAQGPPQDFSSTTAFLQAVSGPKPASRHARRTFGSLPIFLAALGRPSEDLVALGSSDDDTVASTYEVRSLVLTPAVELPEWADRLDIAFGGAAFNQVGVAYLRTRAG
jgi:hypothetical protein